MNQVTNLIQWKNCTEEEKAGFDWSYRYEMQCRGGDWLDIDRPPIDHNIVIRLVIQPEKYYVYSDEGKEIVFKGDMPYITNSLLVRPATEAEIPKPKPTAEDINATAMFANVDTSLLPIDLQMKIYEHESKNKEKYPATQEDRVKAEYPDYDVVMLEWSGGALKYKSINGTNLHIDAQSMKGFYRYVFESEHDGKLFTWMDPVYQHPKHTQVPIAALFVRGEG